MPLPFIHSSVAGSSHCAVALNGAWVLSNAAELQRAVAGFAWPPGAVRIEAGELTGLDTAGAWVLARALRDLEAAGRPVELSGLRPEFAALFAMVRSKDAAVAKARPIPWLEHMGRNFVGHLEQVVAMLAFTGETAQAFLRLLRQPSRARFLPLLHNIQLTGFEALPIVGLLSFLMGVVVSYQGADQLVRYGANIFVADLVGLSMLREMGPLLTAIIVAGRSGSAFTAQIGTMKVTEEIDAMRTIGIAPMDLLVLPKLFALAIALPLLTVYADILGVLGGMMLAKVQLGINFHDFLDRFDRAVSLSSFLVGIGKALVFSMIVALVGCFQGFRVEGSADSVGRQTTVSVVQAIFLVILVDALFSIVFSRLKI